MPWFAGWSMVLPDMVATFTYVFGSNSRPAVSEPRTVLLLNETFVGELANTEVLDGEAMPTPAWLPFQPPPPLKTLPLTVADSTGKPVSPNTPIVIALLEDTQLARLLFI